MTQQHPKQRAALDPSDRRLRRSVRRIALTLGVIAIAVAAAIPGGGRSAASSHEAFDYFDADATGRHYPNAYLLALMSYLVYDGEIPGATGGDFADKFAEHFAPLGLTDFTYISVVIPPGIDTQAMVAETDDAVIVAYRGTQQPIDFVTDAAVVPNLLGVHSGFYDATLAALPFVTAAIDEAGDKELWLTGHSLGGALAQVTAFDYAAANAVVAGSAPTVQGVVTFGSPRVFTALGAAGPVYGVTYGEDQSQRWVNHLDPVPHLIAVPPYLHQSQWTLISVAEADEVEDETCSVVSTSFHPGGIDLDDPILSDHDMDRYATRIFHLMSDADRAGLPLPPLPDLATAACDFLPNLPPAVPTDTDGGANEVAEGAAFSTPVGITASSTDINDGDELTFSLPDDAGGRFAIGADTGIVTVSNAGLLNFEDASSHNITVEASDGELSASATFTILIEDVPPSTPADVDPSANAVLEGAAKGASVGLAAAAADPNGPAVTYSLEGSAGGRFTVDPATGVVAVADGSLLDFETDSSHDVIVRASAGAESSTASFTISVQNVAPSSPLDANAAANEVDEGAAKGTLVGVTAASTDPNGPAVDYSLSDTAGGRFAIDASTGVVSVADASLLDFETAASHGITVEASDGTASTSTDFTIQVLDVAPSTPTDADGGTNAVAEGAAVGTSVGVTASSADPNGPAVNYALTDDAGGRFAVDSSTGVVSVMSPVLLDGPASHDVTVVASHATQSSLPQTFTIQIANVCADSHHRHLERRSRRRRPGRRAR